MNSKSKTFRGRFQSWKIKNNLHGKFAIDRFVLLHFLEALASVSDAFIFKGGVCLWHYIKTPRDTVDLDFTTTVTMSHEQVLMSVTQACTILPDIQFRIEQHYEVDKNEFLGIRIDLSYETEDGIKNKFHVDIIYALPTDLKKIKSPLGNREINAVTLENIIADKISACVKLKSGNSRMKDYDDLWRIALSGQKIEGLKLRKLANERGLPLKLDSNWIGDYLQDTWKRYIQRYKDLPRDLSDLFEEVNQWLKKIEK